MLCEKFKRGFLAEKSFGAPGLVCGVVVAGGRGLVTQAATAKRSLDEFEPSGPRMKTAVPGPLSLVAQPSHTTHHLSNILLCIF